MTGYLMTDWSFIFIKRRITVRQREKDSVRNRKLFMDAAEALFAANGFFLTTIEDIAKRAGFSKGTIYNYFESKEAIFIAILDEKFEKFLSGVRDVVKMEGNFKKILLKIVENHLNSLIKNTNFFRLAAAEQYRFGEKLSHKIHYRVISGYRDYQNLVRDILERFPDSLRKDVPMTELAGTLLGILSSLMTEYILSESSIDIVKKAPTVVSLFLDGAKK